MLKANSISLYWLDDDYTRSFAIKDDAVENKMTDAISELHQTLTTLATKEE